MAIQVSEKVAGQLKELAEQAYGHGSTSAGSGRIGMIGGHVVKFNTHIGERLSKAGSMTNMRECCDALRTHLGKIASEAYGGDFSAGMKKILGKLGLNANGTLRPANRSLLSRSVVAQFIDQVKRDASDLPDGLRDAKGAATVEHSMLTDVMKRTIGMIVEAELKDAMRKPDHPKGAGPLCAVDSKSWNCKGSIRAAMNGLLSGELTLDDASSKVVGIGDDVKEVLKEYLKGLAVRHADVRCSCARAQVAAPFGDAFFDSMTSKVQKKAQPAGVNKSMTADLRRMQQRMEKAVMQLFNASGLPGKILSGELMPSQDESDYFKNEEFTQFFLDAYKVVTDAVKEANRRFGLGLAAGVQGETLKIVGCNIRQTEEDAEYQTVSYNLSSELANTMLGKVQNRIKVLYESLLIRAEANPIGLGMPLTVPVNDTDVENLVKDVLTKKIPEGPNNVELEGLKSEEKESGLLKYAQTWTLQFGDVTVNRKGQDESEESWKGRVTNAFAKFFEKDPETGVLVDRMFKEGLEGGLGAILKSPDPQILMPVRIGMDEKDGPTVNLVFSKRDDGSYQITETREVKGPKSFQHVTNGKDSVNWRTYTLKEGCQANADKDVIRTEYSFVVTPRTAERDSKTVPLVPTVSVPPNSAKFTFQFSEGLYGFDE